MAEQKISSDDDNTKSFRDKCNCMQSCTSIEYRIDIQWRTLNMDNLKRELILHDPNFKFPPLRYTYPRIFFKDDQVKVVKRIESNTWPDFLAFCGGLLGIFLGVSALSIVEIIYYATLRLYFIIYPMEVSNNVTLIQQMKSNILDRFRIIHGICAFVFEFCNNSNIHGVIYFTRRGLHWIERFWWIVAFGVSIWMCSIMTINVWQGWQDNPVKMTFTFNEKPISDIPFPTVTICPSIKSLKHKLDLSSLLFNTANLSNAIRSMRDNKNFRSVLHFCSFLRMFIDKEQFMEFPSIADEDIYDIVQDIGLQLNDVMHKCIWEGQVVNCSMYMVPILTEFGLCFTFNALNSHEIYTDEMVPKKSRVRSDFNITNWSMESGYVKRTIQNDYPFRAYDSGQDAALEISLNMFEKDFEFFCNSQVQEFNVILGAPNDELKYMVSPFRVLVSEGAVITVKPKLTTTSEGLRKYNPNHRKCFFDSERKLRFFKTYTQSNCKEECLANFTRRECGCVKFARPKDKDTPICGVGRMICYYDAEHRLLLHLDSSAKSEREFIKSCNCLPSCTTIEYSAVIDRVQLNQSAIGVNAGRNVNLSGIQQAKLVIYFEERLLNTEQREELYTIMDLIAICGGLLGLFMGISVLSIAEILYFASLRWYWILRRPTSHSNFGC